MSTIPLHIAIIPDGNRRWAKQKGKSAMAGHKYAIDVTFPALLEKASDLGVKYVTFWGLSTENIAKRSKLELEGIFSAIRILYESKLQEMKKNGVCFKFIGDMSGLPDDLQGIFKRFKEETQHNQKITLVLALNYGGRDELLRAIKKINKQNMLNEVTEENFQQYLDTNSIPDPDLIIRTGGEQRLSGFMPWQSVYSELYFSDLYFPDFTAEELEKAVEDFSNRQRRFGK